MRLSICGAVAAVLLVTSSGLAKAGDWSGFYIGGNVGWAHGELNYSAKPEPVLIPGGAEFDFITKREDHVVELADGAVIGGLHFGIQKRYGVLVVGLEGTASYSKLDDQARYDPAQKEPAFGRHADLDVFGIFTLAGKVGVPITPQAMVYGKVGLAVVRSDVSLQYDRVNDPLLVRFPEASRYTNSSTTQTDFGWTIGFGADYKLTDRVLVGVAYDYIHVNVGSRTYERTQRFERDFTFSHSDLDIHSVSARLTFLFNGHRHHKPYK